MESTRYETNEDFINRVNEYHSEIFYTEKNEIPHASKLKNKVSWDIIKKSSAKAIKDVFSSFSEPLGHLPLEHSRPEGTSFRIFPLSGSFAYRCGVRKIIVSMDLRKNSNILSRVSSKNYVIEVSIHDHSENYIYNDKLGYTKHCYIKEFDNTDFHLNVNNAVSEVYRILTFFPIFKTTIFE